MRWINNFFGIVIVVILCAFSTRGQYITHVSLRDDTKVGYGVDMYYYISSVDSLVNRLNDAGDIDKRELLEGIGLPVLSLYDIVDSCQCCTEYDFDVSSFFRKYKFKNLTVDKGTVRVQLNFIKVGYIDVCTIKLKRNIWSGYYFDKAVFINSPVKRKKIVRKELNNLELLQKIITEKYQVGH